MVQKKPTAGIILAAGCGKRFGGSKLKTDIKGKSLIQWVLNAALDSLLEKIILVLGYDFQKILDTIESKPNDPRLSIVINHRYKDGLSGSLKLGFSHVCNTFPSIMFLLGDQPFVEPKTIDYLLEQFWNSEKDICVPFHNNQKGNPTLFSKRFYDDLIDIKGDMGGRKIIESHPDHVLRVELGNPLHFFDVDYRKDIDNLMTRIDNKFQSS